MLEATPTNFFSTTFLLQENGRIVGEIDASLFTQKAHLELADGGYDLYREGLIGDFVMALNGKIVARAVKASVFKNRFEITVPGHNLELRKLNIFSRQFVVFEGDKQVGGIYPLGLFTRRSKIELPASWPLSARVFLFWLAFLIWKKQNAAAS
jgi:hypothetical protein